MHVRLLGSKVEVRMRKGITAHAHLKRGAYQPRNTKIHSSRSMAFSEGKKVSRYSALCRESIHPFFALIWDDDLVGPDCTLNFN